MMETAWTCATAEVRPPAALAGIRILVVSGDATARDRMAALLCRLGAQALPAVPGLEGLRRGQVFRPELIVAIRVSYAECDYLLRGLRRAGIAGTAVAMTAAGAPLAAGDVSDPAVFERFGEDLTGLLIRLCDGSRE